MSVMKLDDINIYEIGNTYQISGTIWSSATHSFITLFPGKETIEGKEFDYLPMELEDWEKFLRQTDLLETEIFGEDENGKVIKAIYRKTQRNIDAFMQWFVFQRDDYSCRYCGRTGIPLTVDHVDLWENGGATVPDNLLSACKSCNKNRGRMEYAEWLKSPTYKLVSNDLPFATKVQNEAWLEKLPALQQLRVKNIRSR